MSGHVFLATSLGDVVPGAEVVVAGREGHHAASVLRVRVGERVEVVDGEGRRVRGVVSDVRKDSVAVMAGEVVDEAPGEPRVVVVQALAKGDRAERAVESLTEVGVDEIVPWSAEHCVSRWRDDKAERGVEKWRTVARAAAKQARRSRLPEIHPLVSTGDLARLAQDADLFLVLDESATTPLADCAIPQVGLVAIVVGPEGGLSDTERAAFAGWGAQIVRLGPTVLRTSTAGTVAAGIVLSHSTRWRDIPAPQGHARMPS